MSEVFVSESPGEPRLAGIVLAAGASRRLGRPKQLVRFEGRTLVERAADLALDVCDGDIVVVVGASADEVTSCLGDRPVRALPNPGWAEGMGRSLAVGIAAVPAHCAAALVLLCDQPLVAAPSLAALIEPWRRDPERLVAAAYRDALGVPAIFPRRLFPELAALGGDRGARAVIAREGDRVLAIALPEAAFDVDDAAAVAELERRST